jgi:hypothetical protein
MISIRVILEWARSKWRGLAIFGFFGLGWILTSITAFVYRSEFFDHHAANTLQEIFVAWSGELIFFTIVGLAITIVSIERPKNPATEQLINRIKILLGSEDVPEGLLFHGREMLQEMAVYHKEVIRTVVFQRYDRDEDAFLVTVRLQAVLCNAMRDLPIRYVYHSRISPDHFSDTFHSPIGRYVSIRVDTENKLHQPLEIAAAGFTTTFEVEMPPLGVRNLEVEYEIWWKANEFQRLINRTYTDYYELRLLNRLDFTPRIEPKEAGMAGRVSLLFNQSTVAITSLAVKPAQVVYEFSVLSPNST